MDDSIKEVVTSINEVLINCKFDISEFKEELPGIPVSEFQLRLVNIQKGIKSDPFIPQEILDDVIRLYDNRVQAMFGVYYSVLDDYVKGLCKGNHIKNLDDNQYWIQNQIIKKLHERRCGIEHIEEEVHNIRD